MLYVFHRDPHLEIPAWVDILVFGYLAKLLRITFPLEKKESESKLNSNFVVGCHNSKKPGELYLPLCQRSSNENTRNECTGIVLSTKAGNICSNCLEKKLDNLSAKLASISEQLCQDEVLEKRKMRWQQVARILDSLFFWIFVLTMTTSTISFYFLIPVR